MEFRTSGYFPYLSVQARRNSTPTLKEPPIIPQIHKLTAHAVVSHGHGTTSYVRVRDYLMHALRFVLEHVVCHDIGTRQPELANDFSTTCRADVMWDMSCIIYGKSFAWTAAEVMYADDSCRAYKEVYGESMIGVLPKD